MCTTARVSPTGCTGRRRRSIPARICPATPPSIFLGKTFAEKYTVSVNAINVANRRVQLDNSLTFGGFHWNDPRQIYGEFRYRFN
jgi:hypothetical protein